MTIEDEKPVLIYSAGRGRLGNQLINFCNLYSISQEYDLRVHCLPFYDYTFAFEEIEGHDSIQLDCEELSTVWKKSIIDLWSGRFSDNVIIETIRPAVLHTIARTSKNAQSIIAGDSHLPIPLLGKHYPEIDFTEETIISKVKDNPISVVSGWNVRAWPIVKKYKQLLVEELQINKDYRDPAMSHLSRLREEHDIIVGVHMRQGDYRTWRNGKFYFDAAYYNKCMEIIDKIKKRMWGFWLHQIRLNRILLRTFLLTSLFVKKIVP